jgi:hypothetical protein
MATLTTRDIGLAIRDFLEDKELYSFNEHGEEGAAETVDFIDVSDAHNPRILLANGQQFIVRIFAGG